MAATAETDGLPEMTLMICQEHRMYLFFESKNMNLIGRFKVLKQGVYKLGRRKQELTENAIKFHRIHVWYMYLHLP